MSFVKKIITTYAKSLFRTLPHESQELEEQVFDFEGLLPKTNFETSLTSFNIDTEISDLESVNNKEKFKKINNLITTRFSFGKELRLIRTVILSSKKVSTFFSDPTYSEKQKEAILLDLFPGCSLFMKAVFRILADRNNLKLLPEISRKYDEYFFISQKKVHLHLSICGSLKIPEGRQFFNNLKKVIGAKELIITSSYNSLLIGGFILEFNSQAIDYTLLKEFSLFFTDL